MRVPRILVAGLRGGGGKTLVATGLAATWRRSGETVAPFKKGPDYIDAAWLSRAAGAPCRNLDPFLMPREAILDSFVRRASRADVGVIEGNRGLFDGSDARGTYSTAELARMLDAPVLLVLDCTKVTRTAAALVLGCQHLDPGVALCGVVLNRIAGRRHEAVVRAAIEETCGVPVLGALPRLDPAPFPERHLGLVPPEEHGDLSTAVENAALAVEGHLDLAAVRSAALDASPLEAPGPAPVGEAGPAGPRVALIGVFRDPAFQFYYPDNLEALEREGARLVEISPLADARLPAVDALYVGGGFPESFAAELAANASFRRSVREAVRAGLPVYAECGGAVYLGERLTLDGTTYPMAGAIPGAFGFRTHPDGHGYTALETVAPNPFFPPGTSLRGHEFHYTFLERGSATGVGFAFRVRKGHGFDGDRDGLVHRNVLASYTHLHALGSPEWAPAVVRAAVRHRGAETASIGGTVSGAGTAPAEVASWGPDVVDAPC
ncbi:MAG: cobyrinate a,c-diamide synthase [Gemmatimonadota bacterium]|jgi:cobyrinic acid a,c-diamide synthase